MKKLVLAVLILQSVFATAQPFGNEWVNADQPHFKFDITREGVYRISYQVLSDAIAANGFNLSTIDPRNLQIFARGQQQFIFVGGEGDGVFDQNDYVEFYAYGNDGTYDTPIYDVPSNHGNPYYSHFNDTISYFLTWNNSTTNARMTLEADIDFTGSVASPYVIRDEVDELHDTYYYGEGYVQVEGVTSPEYTGGEGFYGYYFDGGFTDSFWNLNTSFRLASGPDAEVEISLVGLSGDNKNLTIIGPGINTTTVMQGFNGYRYNYTVPASTLGATTSNFTFDITNSPVNFQFRALVAYVKVRYPMTPNLGGAASAKFFVPDNPNFPTQPKSYVQLAGYNESTPRVYDLTTHKRISVSGSPGSYGFLIPDNGSLKECYITSETSINGNAIAQLIPAGPNGSPYFTDFAVLNPATDHFTISNASMLAEAQAYALHRNTTGHTGIAIDVDELYSQFAWGIRKHPLGIRNFANWTLANLDAPKHLFLVGKSIASKDARTNVANYAMIEVPSYGYPPSDMMFTSRLGNTVLEEPALATGRLAAQNPQQVSDYLSKMQEYEALDPELWMKRMLHFSGGGIQAEVTQLRSYIDSYKTILEDTLIGANVITFQKTSSEPFQITQVDSIRNLINAGVQMTNFFGHGSSVGFDVSIDHPSQFENANGKYPLMMANSCNAGDIHLPITAPITISEEWVLYPRGAMAFLSTTSVGNKFYLNNYATRFVKNLSYGTYGQSVGMAMKKTVADNAQPNNPVTRIHNLLYTLHGDPAFNITNRPLPDLEVTAPNLFYTPTEVTTEQDSFALNIIISNLGRAFTDSFVVDVVRALPNGTSDFTANIIHRPVNYIDTMQVMIPVDFVDGLGINNICVYVDATDTIAESNEMNNQACIGVNVISPDIVPVYPYEFAVMPNQGITLKASTGNPFAAEKTYRFEVDTTDLFNSPLKQVTTITQGGGVVTWTPSLLAGMPDSTVYFWRASVDSATYGFYKWRESSFQYIADKYGWGQAHFFQYKKDDFTSLNYNRPARTFDFLQAFKQLSVNNFGSPTTLSQGEAINYFVDNGREEYLGCVGNIYAPQLLVAVVDPCSLVPWQTPGVEPVTNIFLPGNGVHGQMNCRTRPEKWYAFQVNSPTSMDAFANFVNNVVPDSHHIAILSWLSVDFTAMQPQHLQVFTDLGATQVSTLTNVPYIFYTRKGDNTTTMEVAGSVISDNINLSVDMVGCFGSGQITTDFIGPATQWNSLHLRSNPLEVPNLDSIAVNVIGVRPNGAQEVVITGIQGWSQDIVTLGAQIDAAEFPRLRLSSYLLDDSLVSTPPQLDRWQVLFEGVPEAALNPDIQYGFVGDTLQEGELLMFTVAIENIGDYDMDSLLVHYWIEDENRVRHDIPYARQAPLLVGDVLIDTIYTNPIDFVGGNKFWVEVNPINDQLEQYHFNNIGSLQFSVAGDRINPILDVTFDAVHILDGDIVSSRPMIVMEVKDESQFRLLNDTSDFQVFLKEPEAENLTRIWFANYQVMQFYPGELPDNKARLEWNPTLMVDGVYELWVQAYDKSSNASGDTYYRISFEVVNKPSITNVLNYPNPFSTSTQFVFTMTGSEQPDYFKIQILTITGKVVKEITSDEIGPMNIGRNVTAYAWDGKDRYGDQLANGVYLYRVVAKLDGNYMELRESGADNWIESGFGKMMLIR